MMSAAPIPFQPDWPEPDLRFLRDERPSPPIPPVDDVFSGRWASWIRGAADAKSAPVDYVLAALLSVTGAVIGNNRWVAPYDGWHEPPVLWAMAIGNPSMNKSPGLDAVLEPLKRAERYERQKAQSAVNEWRERAEVAKLIESAWKEEVKAALKNGAEPKPRPDGTDPGPEPVMPRLAVSDATVEKLAVIADAQPRGVLLARDELSGWLQGMVRYSGGGSDRPFWLEAYGGRAYSVERMGRAPVYVEHLAVGVLGGIQPDRLRSLLIQSDDDGLLARFMPIWPNPAPLQRPRVWHDKNFLEQGLSRLLSLAMEKDQNGQEQPKLLPFTEQAAQEMHNFRVRVREWESGTDGLLLSFIGKLPGLSARLSLVLAMLDWASGDTDEPDRLDEAIFRRAKLFAASYLLPMARRAYADVNYGKAERAGRRLVSLLLENQLSRFTTREIRRMERAGLSNMDDINAGVAALEQADIVRRIETPPSSGDVPGGGVAYGGHRVFR